MVLLKYIIKLSINKVKEMEIYRIRQFLWGLESYFKKIDNKYIDIFLDENEKQLFNKLRHNEKHHSIRVCKDAISIAKFKRNNIDINRVGKAALLHDVGKGEYGLNLLEKSTLVILNKITRGKLKKFSHIRPIDIYYNHAEKGANILKEFRSYDKEFLDSIRYHHLKSKVTNNELLNIIKESDDKN